MRVQLKTWRRSAATCAAVPIDGGPCPRPFPSASVIWRSVQLRRPSREAAERALRRTLQSSGLGEPSVRDPEEKQVAGEKTRGAPKKQQKKPKASATAKAAKKLAARNAGVASGS